MNYVKLTFLPAWANTTSKQVNTTVTYLYISGKYGTTLTFLLVFA